VTALTETVWPLEPHTRAKHEILRRYLEAWSAILSLGGFPTIAYVDGFAGPGAYDNGEDGSPIIALKSALTHQMRIKAEHVPTDSGRSTTARFSSSGSWCLP
jgi:three-Cys-motif partner protein